MTDPARARTRSPNDPSLNRAASVIEPANAFAALQEAYHAAACVRCLLVHVEGVSDSQRYFTRSELKALHAVIDSEVERRLQIARLAIESESMA